MATKAARTTYDLHPTPLRARLTSWASSLALLLGSSVLLPGCDGGSSRGASGLGAPTDTVPAAEPPAPDEESPSDPSSPEPPGTVGADLLQGRELEPVEWRFPLASAPARPFDVAASAVFEHEASGTRLETRLFHEGDRSWTLRFTPTRPGRWSFRTSSEIAELDDLTGAVHAAPAPEARGFVSRIGNRWAWSGTGRAFVPNHVMWRSPRDFAGRPDLVDAAIQTFLVEHGFTGLHVGVFDEWYQLGASSPDEHASANPDPRTFEALEMLIRRVHAAGGAVHLWFTGDCGNDRCSRWRPGSDEQRRLLRYIGARLGPLPGWTMGYGFDIEEDHSAEDVALWHAALDAAIPWPHFLGARTGRDFIEDGLYRTDDDPLCSSCDYESWVDHKPGYDDYARILDRNPDEPCFLEDRFRIRDEGRVKDFTMTETRRGLWRATMAGGCAGIWGHLIDGPATGESAPYPNPEQIRIWNAFWADRFRADLLRCNELASEGWVCLRSPGSERLVFYGEGVGELSMDLRALPRATAAVAFDTLRASSVVGLGELAPGLHGFDAPHRSDWVVVVGPD